MFSAMMVERPNDETDPRRRARQIRVRREVRRILVDFREAAHDRGRPECRRPRPVRIWR